MKKWFWYDGLLVALRTLWLVIIVSTAFVNPSLIDAPVGAVLSLALAVYLIPLTVRYKKEERYLAVEVATAGLFHLYLAYAAPELLWSFVLFVMIISLTSSRKSSVWTGILCGIIFPILNGWIADRLPYEFIVNCSLGFAIGFSFNILIQSHKQSRIIQEQKLLLEQHI
ncbi:two-component system sensor histidine kinase/response regulator, partial [Clostridium perfringens]